MSNIFNSPKIITTEADSGANVTTISDNGYVAIVGEYAWGPNQSPVYINSKSQFLNTFKFIQNVDNLKTLGLFDYTSNLLIVRSNGQHNASAAGQPITINDFESYERAYANDASISEFTVVGRYPGAYGNDITVKLIAPNKNTYTITNDITIARGNSVLTLTGDVDTIKAGDRVKINNKFYGVNSVSIATDTTIILNDIYFGITLTSVTTDLEVNLKDSVASDQWQLLVFYKNVLQERYFADSKTDFSSLASEVNISSKYVIIGTDELIDNSNDYIDIILTGGSNLAINDVSSTFLAIDKLKDDYNYKIIIGKNTVMFDNYITQNILEYKKSVIGYYGRPKIVTNDPVQESLNYEATIIKSSYIYYVEHWKKCFFAEINGYVYIPCSIDGAGLFINNFKQPKYQYKAPAGPNRGVLVNCYGLDPYYSVEDRDILWQRGINCIVKQPDNGAFVLFGDKTFIAGSSDFSRINIRSMFIDIQKQFVDISKSYLFEFNDETTRNRFKSAAIVYLNKLLSDGAIEDFEIICDSTNNPPAVVTAKQFKANVKIKPKHAINYILLDFSTFY